MKEHITLLKPKISKHVYSVLGYDPKENTYKLLSVATFYMPCQKYQKPQILTLGSQESWRVIENSPDNDPNSSDYCINGVVYYTANICYDEEHISQVITPALRRYLAMRIKEIIMSFDVRSEKFQSIEIPGRVDEYGSDITTRSLMSYQGKLAWVNFNSNIIKIWVLQDNEKQEWSVNEFVLPLPQRDLLGSAWLRGATSTGEFIYVSGKLFKDISVFYYNPVRESIRSIKGLECENFRRCYGSSNDRMLSLYPLPDHIESLMSLKNIICQFTFISKTEHHMS